MWISIASIIVGVILVVLFCCVRVGAKADREMEKLLKEEELFD